MHSYHKNLIVFTIYPVVQVANTECILSNFPGNGYMNHANGNKATAGNVPKITKLYKIVIAIKQTLALNFNTGDRNHALKRY